VRLRVRLCPEVESWILGFGEEAYVVRPKALRLRLEGKVRAAADAIAKRDREPSRA
jgi:hypothetical protein